MKHRAKKASSNDKVERLKTGGGTFNPEVDVTSEKVLSLLGNRATPLTNPFDSDALYNNESGWLYFLSPFVTLKFVLHKMLCWHSD
jgi:hypothetical protein